MGADRPSRPTSTVWTEMEMRLAVQDGCGRGETRYRLRPNRQAASPEEAFVWSVSEGRRRRSLVVPADAASELLDAALEVLARPRPGPGPFGLDGTSYRLTIGRGKRAVSFSWWCEPGPGGEPHERTARLLENLGDPGAPRTTCAPPGQPS